MKRIAIIALSFTLSGCNPFNKKEDVVAKKPDPPSPVGKWESRTNPGAPYMYWRYEFKTDHSFVKESGSSSGTVTRKITGSWDTVSQEAPHYSTGTSLSENMQRAAGILPELRPAGTIILKYSVVSKSDIGVGATLVAERGPIMEPAKQTYDLEEHLAISVDKNDGKEFLNLGRQRLERMNP